MFRRSTRSDDAEISDLELRSSSEAELLRRARALLHPEKGARGIEMALRILDEVLDRYPDGGRRSDRRRNRGDAGDMPSGDRPRHRE